MATKKAVKKSPKKAAPAAKKIGPAIQSKMTKSQIVASLADSTGFDQEAGQFSHGRVRYFGPAQHQKTLCRGVHRAWDDEDHYQE